MQIAAHPDKTIEQKNFTETVPVNSKSIETAVKRCNELIWEGISKFSNQSVIRCFSPVRNEQASGATLVNKAIQQLNSIVQSNTSSSEELAANADQPLVIAREQKELVSF